MIAVHCSFCEKTLPEAVKIVADPPRANICRGCILLACDAASIGRASLIEHAAELAEAVEAFLPTNIDLLNAAVPDETVIPLDCTLGELRHLAAALVQARGQRWPLGNGAPAQ